MTRHVLHAFLVSVLVAGPTLGICGAAPGPTREGAVATPILRAPDVVPGAVVRTGGGLVVSEDALASQVGRDVLEAGGNAVDAAIATAFALAVTHPAAGNVGGGGFMVIRFPDGTATALDYRERAPAAAHPEMFLDATGVYQSRLHHDSHLAVGVPGSVAGLEKAHRLHGSLPWERLVAPAVELAERGFVVGERLARGLEGLVETAGERGHEATVRAFSKDGTPYFAGEVLRQPDLARTLERIRRDGRDGFYRGETARLVAAEMRRGGGLITEEDMARYQAWERAPVRGSYRGHEVISMPPPSSGGVALVTMLNVLEGFDLAAMGHGSPAHLHHLAEAMRLAYRDRARHLADPDRVDVPIQRLTSKAHAAELRAAIDPRRAGVSNVADLAVAVAATAPEGTETTHYSIVDADGLAVAVTTTLEESFGSKITVSGAGFLLNNEMGDFNAGPGLTDESGLIGTGPNLARPGQRMLSSMTPTIVAKDGELVAVLGSPGGRTIINTVLALVVGIVDFDLGIEHAVAAPRMHHQWLPDRITLEAAGFPATTVERLEAMGHRIHFRDSQGLAHSIGVDSATGERIGAPDPRNPEAAAAHTSVLPPGGGNRPCEELEDAS